jgi:N-ethylmaleimide reductase
MQTDPNIQEMIAKSAYDLWEKRGRPQGSSDIDWLNAEKVVRHSRPQQGIPLVSCATSHFAAGLLDPFSLGDLSLKNRVVMAPMTRGRAGEERMPNQMMAVYYKQRSGAGLIISEGTEISKQGYGWHRTSGIYSNEQENAWKLITNAVHSESTPMFLQLWHCGRASHSAFHDGELPVAPSAVKIELPYIHTPHGREAYEVPRALETDEISQIVEDFRRAAQRAKNAGFDGVEIHGANGYLIDTFLQSKTNLRTDKYGGSIPNRFVFLQEVVEAVLSVWPSNRVAVRLTPNGNYNDMGSSDFRETFTYVAARLNDYSLGYLHIVDGLDFGRHHFGEPMTLREVRQIFKNPLMGNCGYDQERAEAAIRNRDTDLISFGRLFISNPDLVDRFKNGWPLAEIPDIATWYAPSREGYVDFPAHK